MKDKPTKIIISGGGTGGHVFPAIAIADALKKIDSSIEIHFVGAKGKIEMEKVPKAGYSIDGLWITGLQRKLTLKNLLFPIKVIHSLWNAWKIVRKFKPDVVVGVGGYASYPVVAVAANMGIPALLQEQNSYAGLVNKQLKNKVKKVCVAYDKMEKYFPKEKIVLTGNPVRNDILEVKTKKAEAYKHFGFDPGKKTIIIIGGSLGARTLNQSLAAAHDLLKGEDSVQVLWQIGKLYIDNFGQEKTAQLPSVKGQAFVDRMDLAYAMADLMICRAGASTISELCLVGQAAILVPSPNVAEDHQTKNAMALVDKNAAVLIKDNDAISELIPQALELLGDEERLALLSKNSKLLAKPNAAEVIAKEVLSLRS